MVNIKQYFSFVNTVLSRNNKILNSFFEEKQVNN